MRSQAIEYAVNKLLDNQLFTEIIGDQYFIEKKLQENVKYLYIEKNVEDGVEGRYNISNRSIIIYGYDDVDVFEEEFIDEKEKDVKQTMLHEGIHAVLTNFEEREKIKYSTGILELYDNGQECGRGLNEALTEWILEKSGLKSTAYRTELKLLKQIEMAIGEKQVMKMARGGIETNIANILKMNGEECVEFLSVIDTVHFINKESNDVQRVIGLLEEKNRKIKINPNRVREIDKKLSVNKIYSSMLQGEEYKIYLEQNELEDTMEEKIEYLKKIEQNYKENLNYGIASIELEIYDRYIKDELEIISLQETFSYEEAKKYLERYDNYMSLIMATNKEVTELSTEEYKENRSALLAMQLKYNQDLRGKLINVIARETVGRIQNRRISAKEIIENINVVLLEKRRKRELYGIASNENVDSGENVEELMVNEISKAMVPENAAGFAKILINKYNIDKNDNQKSGVEILQELQEVITLKTKKEDITIYKLDDGTVGMLRGEMLLSEGIKLIKSDGNIENKERLFDFTLNGDDCQDMNIVIRNFEKLKDEIEQRLPGAEIRILNEVIYVKGKETEEFYINEGNNWTRLENIQKGTMQYQDLEVKENKENKERKNFAKKIATIIKKIVQGIGKRTKRNNMQQLPNPSVVQKEKKFADKLDPRNYSGISETYDKGIGTPKRKDFER